jgi:hypothetical protein
MHMPPPSAQETAKAIELGHEPSTVSVKGVVWFFIVFFAFAAVVHVIIYVLYDQLVKYEESQNVARSALTASSEVHPPEPRLQPTRIWHETTEPEDLALMHGQENLEFVKRGWITDAGDFRVPDDVINKVSGTGGTSAGTMPANNPASGGTGAGMAK